MSESKRIDQLFESARQEAPKRGYQETKTTLIKATGVGLFGTLMMKWGFLSTKLKAIIMIGSIGALALSVGVIMSSFGKKEHTPIVQAEVTPTKEVNPQNVEIENTGNIATTKYFDEEDNVIKVVVDSQKEKVPEESFILPIDTFTSKRIIETLEIPDVAVRIMPISKDTVVETDEKTGKRVVFRITEKTTSEELENIFEKAKAAGLAVDYKTKIRRNLIKKINWRMAIDSEEGKISWNTNITSSKTFSCMLGWIEDESGKGIDFITKTKTSCCISY